MYVVVFTDSNVICNFYFYGIPWELVEQNRVVYPTTINCDEHGTPIKTIDGLDLGNLEPAMNKLCK